MKMPLVTGFYFRASAIGLGFALLSLNTTAQELVNNESSPAIDIRYLGGDNEALFFNVKYDNRAGNAFKLVALDETGEACFQDNYSVKEFDKRIKVPRLTDTDYVIFLIRSTKQNIQHSYKVKVTTKVVDETFVVKNRELVSYK